MWWAWGPLQSAPSPHAKVALSLVPGWQRCRADTCCQKSEHLQSVVQCGSAHATGQVYVHACPRPCLTLLPPFSLQPHAVPAATRRCSWQSAPVTLVSAHGSHHGEGAPPGPREPFGTVPELRGGEAVKTLGLVPLFHRSLGCTSVAPAPGRGPKCTAGRGLGIPV